MVGVLAAYLLLLLLWIPSTWCTEAGPGLYVLRCYGVTMLLRSDAASLKPVPLSRVTPAIAAFYRNLNCRHINLLLSYGPP